MYLSMHIYTHAHVQVQVFKLYLENNVATFILHTNTTHELKLYPIILTYITNQPTQLKCYIHTWYIHV